MARIWANRLEAGTKEWRQVPISRREEVKACLLSDVTAGVITPERYKAITGQEYNM